MIDMDLLSDTTYRQQAVRQLHQLLSNAKEFPVESSQIYGLRQIARQQPDKVEQFARHQKERAEKKDRNAEIGFWALVENLCNNQSTNWSVRNEGRKYLPENIRNENIPKNQQGMTLEERQLRNKLRKCQQEWLDRWKNEHIPVFFERFCTQCMYRKAIIEMGQSGNESDVSAHQEQSETGGSEAMQQAFADAGLQE